MPQNSNTNTGGHSSLAQALLAFQAEAPTLLKASTAKAGSYSYKYVDLADVMASIQPLLTKHGLVWQTFPCTLNGEPALRYTLTHAASGESVEDTMALMMSKADPQGQGSGITYGRRYALTAVLNLIADADDDGSRAARAARSPGVQPQAVPDSNPLLTDQQRDRVLSAIADTDQNEQLLFAAVGVSSVDELTVEHAKKIRELLDNTVAVAS